MKKPKVIRCEKYEKVGNERVGLYWWWRDPPDENPIPPGVAYKGINSAFHSGLIYQEYEGEVPPFPVEKSNKEKLGELIEAAEVVAKAAWSLTCQEFRDITALKELINEFKEK